MSADFRFSLLAGIPVIAGLAVLHLARRKKPEDSRGLGLRRGLAFVLAGFLLVIVPLAVWSSSLLGSQTAHPHPVSPASVLLLAGYLDAAFLWMIWNISAWGYRPPVVGENQWDTNWGESYSPELKKRLLGPVLDQLNREGKIGNLVIDIGSGAAAVSQLLPPAPGRKFIFIDIAAKNRVVSDTLFLRLDAECVTRVGRLSHQKAVVRAGRFLGREPRMRPAPEGVTTLLFSDILNYVDYRAVIRGFSKFLQPEGRIIIANLPTRGITAEFSAKGLRRNEELFAFLEEQGFEIESKDFPCRPKGATVESEEMIVLVARKAVSPEVEEWRIDASSAEISELTVT